MSDTDTATHKVLSIPEEVIPYLKTEPLWGESVKDESSVKKDDEGNIIEYRDHQVTLLMIHPRAEGGLLALFGGGAPKKYLVIVVAVHHTTQECGNPTCSGPCCVSTNFLSSYIYEDLLEATSDASDALKRIKGTA